MYYGIVQVENALLNEIKKKIRSWRFPLIRIAAGAKGNDIEY